MIRRCRYPVAFSNCLRPGSGSLASFRFFLRFTAAFLLAITCAATLPGQRTFTNPLRIPLPDGMYQLLAGDLRGTGRQDLIYWTGYTAADFYDVILNEGNHNFADLGLVQTSQPGTSRAVLGDFNGDGKLDLVLGFVNGADGYGFYFYAGNGDGTFAAPVTSVLQSTSLFFPNGATELFAADMNGDGHLDIVAATPYDGSGTVVIATGDGHGRFSLASTFQAEATVRAVVDLNRDGLPDLVTENLDGANANTDLVPVYINQGNGQFKLVNGFVPKASLAMHSIAVADMNGDGLPDLVWEDQVNLYLALGQGDGTFVLSAQTPFPVPVDPFFQDIFTISDLNGDGIPDIVIGSEDTYSVLLGKGNFKFQGTKPVMVGELYPNTVAIDLDGTGRISLAVPSSILDPDGTGIFILPSSPQGQLLPVDGYYAWEDMYSAVEGHFTQGPGPDIAIRPWHSAIPEVLRNDGTGAFAPLPNPNPPQNLYGPFPSIYDYLMQTGDFNGDGKADLIEYGVDLTNLRDGDYQNVLVAQTWYGNGDGTFQRAVPLAGYDSLEPIGILTGGDLNHDGATDIAVTYQGAVDILLGQADKTFKLAQTIQNPNLSNISTVAFGDFNGDCIQDMVTFDAYNLDIYIGKGDGTFTPGALIPFSAYTSALPIVVADLDGDGKVDLLLDLSSQLLPYYGNGDGTFKPGAAIPFSAYPSSTATSARVADMDRDGWPDIAVWTNGRVRVLFGKGSRQWTMGPEYLAGSWMGPPMLEDLNQDGFPDIAIGGVWPPAVAVLLNQPGKQNLTGTLTFNPEPQPEGGGLNATVVLTPARAGAALPTGTVELTIDGIPAASAKVSGTQTTFPVPGGPGLAPGNHFAVATYSGDNNFNSIRILDTHVVTGATIATETELTASPNPANFGAAVTLSATVSVTGGTIKAIPTGSVRFAMGSVWLGTSTLGAGLVAQWVTSALPVGTDPIVATYSGDSKFPASTSPVVDVVIKPVASQTSLACLPTSTTVGAPVTCTATVTAASIVPSGQVAFFDGAKPLGNATLSGGKATFVTTTLAVGTHEITAGYLGNPQILASTSSAVTVVIDYDPAHLSLTSSLNPSYAGQNVTFNAVIEPEPASSARPLANPACGFYDGTTPLGPAIQTGSGAMLNTSSLSAGKHAISVSCPTNGIYADLSGTLTQTVLPDIATRTTLSCAPLQAVVGTRVQCTATVISSSGTPAGTITLRDGANSIATATLKGSSAVFSTTSLAIGSHALTAGYGGAVPYLASASQPVTVTMTADFTLSASPSSASLYTGERSSFTITATSAAALPAISFLCSGLPAKTTCTFSSIAVSGHSGETKLTLATSPPVRTGNKISGGTPPGTYLIKVLGIAHEGLVTVQHSASLKLVVKSLF